MNRKLPLFLGILAIVLGIVGASATYTIHQTQQAIVLMFGNPKRVIVEPGLKFKVPFAENVQFYEKRVLNLDPPVESILLADQKRILVDAFARYRLGFVRQPPAFPANNTGSDGIEDSAAPAA